MRMLRLTHWPDKKCPVSVSPVRKPQTWKTYSFHSPSRLEIFDSFLLSGLEPREKDDPLNYFLGFNWESTQWTISAMQINAMQKQMQWTEIEYWLGNKVYWMKILFSQIFLLNGIDILSRSFVFKSFSKDALFRKMLLIYSGHCGH